MIQAAHVAPARRRASGPSRRLLSSSGVRCRCARRIGSATIAPPQTPTCGKSASPPGAACAARVPHGTRGHRAPGPSRGPSAALPSRESGPPCSARRGPRCAHRLPPRLNRRDRRVGASRRLSRRPRLALLRRARGGRMAPRCAKPRARPEGSGRRARGPKSTRPGPRRCAPLRLNACTAFALAAPTVPAIARSWTTRAQNPPRCCAAPRVPLLALRLAFSVSLLRSLHSQREPPGSRPSPIAPGLAPGANHAALRAAQAALAASASHQAIAAASLGQPRSCRIIRPPRLPAFLTMNTLAALA